MEFRINAEDPVTFAPHPGKIKEFHLPGGPGVRVDTAAYRDYVIPPHYDSLIAKLIVRGKDRAETLARARRALEQFVIEGVKTSIPLHRQIVSNEKFMAGDFSTKFMDTFLRG
jgi:acetyl-CoA carboxylase biotin carboxylase subunit